MTKRICFLIGIWVGIVLGAWVSLVGNNAQWKMEAWKHHAAVWRSDKMNDRLYWQWQDDYLKPASQPTPRPYRVKVIINGGT